MKAEVAEGQALTLLRDLVAAERGELATALAELPATEVFGPLLAASGPGPGASAALDTS